MRVGPRNQEMFYSHTGLTVTPLWAALFCLSVHYLAGEFADMSAWKV